MTSPLAYLTNKNIHENVYPLLDNYDALKDQYYTKESKADGNVY